MSVVVVFAFFSFVLLLHSSSILTTTTKRGRRRKRRRRPSQTPTRRVRTRRRRAGGEGGEKYHHLFFSFTLSLFNSRFKLLLLPRLLRMMMFLCFLSLCVLQSSFFVLSCYPKLFFLSERKRALLSSLYSCPSKQARARDECSVLSVSQSKKK